MIIVDIFFELIGYFIFKCLLNGIGIGTKWLFHLGKKPLAIIRKEGLNESIGFLVLMALILSIVFLTN